MRNALVPFAALALSACALAPAQSDASPDPVPVSPKTNGGALALLPALDAEAGPTRNVFYSPASIEQAFAVLALGAEGETRAQIQSVLSPPSGTRDLETEGKGVEVRVANALWLSDLWEFRPSYLAATRQQYDATAQRVDMAQAQGTADLINAWADKQTRGLIPRVIAPSAISPDDAAFITNALYFNGSWLHEFDQAGKKPFLFGDGHEEPFDMMNEAMTVPYATSDAWRAVRLPYTNPRYAMDVLLPAKRSARISLPDAATIANLDTALTEAEPRLVDVTMPRFEIDTDVDLIPTLAQIGLTLPFDQARADFSQMAAPGQRPLYVNGAWHLAKLQVYEQGTKAAAVTVVRIVPTAAGMPPKDPEMFVADHPFLVLIRDLDRGTVLFLGKISAPRPFVPPVQDIN